MSTRFGLVPLYRLLARRSRFQLSAGYLLCTTLASTIYFLGSSRALPGLMWGAALLNLVAVSLLFTVVTWYRTDEVVNAALFLAVTATFGFTIGVWVTTLFLVQGAGAILVAGGSIFSIPIRILVLIMVFGALVSLGRHFRRFFAPATLDGADGERKSAA